MPDVDQDMIEEVNETFIREQLQKGSRNQVQIKYEDRLAATINQHMLTFADWVLLQEELDTLEAMAHPETGTKVTAVRNHIEAEIKRILKVAAPVHYKLQTVIDKIISLSALCEKPLRADIQKGFPRYLRERVDQGCFNDALQPTAQSDSQ